MISGAIKLKDNMEITPFVLGKCFLSAPASCGQPPIPRWSFLSDGYSGLNWGSMGRVRGIASHVPGTDSISGLEAPAGSGVEHCTSHFMPAMMDGPRLFIMSRFL